MNTMNIRTGAHVLALSLALAPLSALAQSLGGTMSATDAAAAAPAKASGRHVIVQIRATDKDSAMAIARGLKNFQVDENAGIIFQQLSNFVVRGVANGVLEEPAPGGHLGRVIDDPISRPN